jgi:molybdopterin biosynthesis enzyme MoaB
MTEGQIPPPAPSIPALPHTWDPPRVLVGAVSQGRSRTLEELSAAACDEIRAGGCKLVRSVTVNYEAQFIQQLVSNVSNENEADAIILLGGTGFGARDHSCEAVNAFVERRIEGFAGAYRRLLESELDFGPHAWLVRATAGVYNQCLVFAMSGRLKDIRRAMQKLIVPTLPEAVALATGKLRAVHLRA